MSTPASGPVSHGPRRTAQGTIVGMPPVVREPARLGLQSSSTLRSVYAPDEAPCSDAYHPERWSNPPAAGTAPIIPCEEPEEEDDAEIYVRPRPAPAAERTAPSITAWPSLDRVEPPPVVVESVELHSVAVELDTVAAATELHAAEPESPASLEPPTARWHVPAIVVPDDEPVVLPFRDRNPGADRRLLAIGGIVSAVVLALAVIALLWL